MSQYMFTTPEKRRKSGFTFVEWIIWVSEVQLE
jgi:hypothetical protein